MTFKVKVSKETRIFVYDNKDGTVFVFYLPTTPGIYEIVGNFEDQRILDHPTVVKMTNSHHESIQLIIYSYSPLHYKLPVGVELSNLSASITAPSGFQQPLSLKRTSNGTVDCFGFNAHEPGDHDVAFVLHDEQIADSPFKFTVLTCDFADASEVRVHGDAVNKAIRDGLNSFTINSNGAGIGGLSVSMEDPSEVKFGNITTVQRSSNNCWQT